MRTEKKIGDKVYGEYADGIGLWCMVIEDIEPRSYVNHLGETIDYNLYKNHTEHSCVEDYNCLDDDDPRIEAYEEDKMFNKQVPLYEVCEWLKDNVQSSDIDITKLINDLNKHFE